MARKNEQGLLFNIHIDDVHAHKGMYAFDMRKMNKVQTKSRITPVSGNRVFRMFCNTMTTTSRIERDEQGRAVKENDEIVRIHRPIKSFKEFLIFNFQASNKKNMSLRVKKILKKGLLVIFEDGTEVVYKRCATSASQTRLGKRLFTCLDVDMVREAISYGAKFDADVVIANMEARYGLAESTTKELYTDFTFDIMPDYAIEREHKVMMYDWQKDKLYEELMKKVYEPADGQGTILPSAAVKVAFDLGIISFREKNRLLEFIVDWYGEDINQAYHEGDEEFLTLWRKIPSAFQVRFGFAKGLLVVHPHNLETMDCNKQDYRTKGKCMSFFAEKGEVDADGKHHYDFNRDIMFTDSMWKENFDPKYLFDAEDSDVPQERRARLEIVLWQKPRSSDRMFMGHQYWQALNQDKISPKEYAEREIANLKETIFTDANEAKMFLGMYDTGRDANEYGERMGEAGGKIQKVIELLNENPELIEEKFVQQTLRKTREKFIKDMMIGRIPVAGANVYVATAVEVQFGRESRLAKGEYYLNGGAQRLACFRSPCIDKSEPAVINTKDVPEYNGLYRDILILNPFDDILPRLGGADTDGDKFGVTPDKGIIDAVHADLPMLFDEGGEKKKKPNTWDEVLNYDIATIITDVKSIGEITNYALTWKDIQSNPKLMKRLGLSYNKIERTIRILRFIQGWSIDFAKTGFFPGMPKGTETLLSPHWMPWSQGQVNAGIEGAEVYQSQSQLGQLYNSVKDYMENKFMQEAKESTRDFTFEFTEGADLEEVERIKPIIAEMELNYRRELMALQDMKLSEDDEKEYMAFLMDKYQNAAQSLDADIRSIAAAAYVHTYHESSSKGKSISYAWLVGYEGLLMNVADSTDVKRKLRKVSYTGNIGDIPMELKFYKGVAKGEHFTAEAKVLNGTYRTFRRGGQLFVEVKGRSYAKDKAKQVSRPVNTHIAFEMKGFKSYGVTPQEILELLKENDGMVRVQREFFEEANRAVVYVGDQAIGGIGRNHKFIFASHTSNTQAVELRIQNVDALSPTYITKRGKEEKPVSAFFFDSVVVGYMEVELEKKKRTSRRSSSDTYFAEESYYAAADEGSVPPPMDDYAPPVYDEYDYAGAGYDEGDAKPDFEMSEEEFMSVEDFDDEEMEIEDEDIIDDEIEDIEEEEEESELVHDDLDDLIDDGVDSDDAFDGESPHDVHLTLDDMPFSDADVEDAVVFDEAILAQINKKASYWKYSVRADELNIASAQVEVFGRPVVGKAFATVTLTSVKGVKRSVNIKAVDAGILALDTDVKYHAEVTALILQVAHYELYAERIRKQA